MSQWDERALTSIGDRLRNRPIESHPDLRHGAGLPNHGNPVATLLDGQPEAPRPTLTPCPRTRWPADCRSVLGLQPHKLSFGSTASKS